jgi:parallel beta-helix repeat protein
VIGNVVNNVGDYQNPCRRVQGIYYSNLGGHALENVVYRNHDWGIHAWHAASRTVIANNSAFNNGYGGILIGAGDDPGNKQNDYTVVANNIVYRNGLNPKAGRYGIEEFGKPEHTTSTSTISYTRTAPPIGICKTATSHPEM